MFIINLKGKTGIFFYKDFVRLQKKNILLPKWIKSTIIFCILKFSWTYYVLLHILSPQQQQRIMGKKALHLSRLVFGCRLIHVKPVRLYLQASTNFLGRDGSWVVSCETLGCVRLTLFRYRNACNSDKKSLLRGFRSYQSTKWLFIYHVSANNYRNVLSNYLKREI